MLKLPGLLLIFKLCNFRAFSLVLKYLRSPTLLLIKYVFFLLFFLKAENLDFVLILDLKYISSVEAEIGLHFQFHRNRNHLLQKRTGGTVRILP